jgi:hypothetical protein
MLSPGMVRVGYACHFGLGQFVAVGDEAMKSDQ